MSTILSFPLRVLGLALLLVPVASAHCDGLDGPVVAAARKALDKGDPSPALIWVHAEQEAEVRAAFARSLEVRRTAGPARDLADQFFFETLVRLHRVSEGAPYTGLKPAGRDLGPVIPAGDRALASGDLKPVWKLLNEAAHRGLHTRFEAARKAGAVAEGDLAGGRRYVATYVDFMHYLEGLHTAAAGPAGGCDAHP